MTDVPPPDKVEKVKLLKSKKIGFLFIYYYMFSTI